MCTVKRPLMELLWIFLSSTATILFVDTDRWVEVWFICHVRIMTSSDRIPIKCLAFVMSRSLNSWITIL
jgi:hypothetical protein